MSITLEPSCAGVDNALAVQHLGSVELAVVAQHCGDGSVVDAMADEDGVVAALFAEGGRQPVGGEVCPSGLVAQDAWLEDHGHAIARGGE